MMRNPYEVLGVSATATQDEIRNVYRKLAKKHHPDLNPGNKANEEKFKEITAAYDLVGSAENREKFDKGELEEAAQAEAARKYYKHTQGGPRARYSASSDFDDDFLNSMFGNVRGSGGRGARSGATFSMPGQDVLYTMEVDFRDAILGTEKTLSLPGGKKIQTKIPPGFKTGQKLRFAGQGSPGMGSGAAGDLYVEIIVRPSDVFVRNENNIESEVPVSLQVALLGGELNVQTVDGSVMLNVPQHSNTGTKLRIRGKGVPSDKGIRGDHIVKLKVMLPDPPDPKLDSLVREWSENTGAKGSESRGETNT